MGYIKSSIYFFSTFSSAISPHARGDKTAFNSRSHCSQFTEGGLSLDTVSPTMFVAVATGKSMF